MLCMSYRAEWLMMNICSRMLVAVDESSQLLEHDNIKNEMRTLYASRRCFDSSEFNSGNVLNSSLQKVCSKRKLKYQRFHKHSKTNCVAEYNSNLSYSGKTCFCTDIYGAHSAFPEEQNKRLIVRRDVS